VVISLPLDEFDRIPEGVDAQRSKRAHHRIGRWEEKSEDERGGVG
jgi:hypothetical protein